MHFFVGGVGSGQTSVPQSSLWCARLCSKLIINCQLGARTQRRKFGQNLGIYTQDDDDTIIQEWWTLRSVLADLDIGSACDPTVVKIFISHCVLSDPTK